MSKRFDHQAIEKKWQTRWKESNLYSVGVRDESKEKKFILTEFPYPSGNLHIGHWYAFAVPDIYVRTLRMQGNQVLYPIGFDSFGLPAENAAIKRKLDPREWTYDNIAYMTRQLESMGNAFDWSRMVITSNPEYYRWTQWIFLQFFKKDLAYRGVGQVNWCPTCNTVLANEQVSDGKCERCGTTVELREMPEWKMRITKYADRLIDDLEPLAWPEHIKDLQRNWIGRSRGAELTFKLSTGDDLKVFTTRPDTLYGATFVVIAPEHKLIEQLKPSIKNWDEVAEYQQTTAKKNDIERQSEGKEKTGVKLEGVTATNPANGEAIPVFIADYVLARYGTGALMAVPAHDERDHEFAKKFDIPTKQVIRKVFGESLPNSVPRIAVGAIVHDPVADKYLVQYSHEFKKHSFIFGGLEDTETHAEAAVRETLEETGISTKFVRYITDETESHFFHPGKKINRALVSRRALLELLPVPQREISEEELQKQKPVWLSKDELLNELTTEEEAYAVRQLFSYEVFVGSGTLCNSSEFDGMDSGTAAEKIVAKVGGKMTSTYKVRDWSISRQRYWGVPIPIVYDPEGEPHAVPDEHLPWTLPSDVDVTPTGEPPLAKSKELKERTEKLFGKGWTPEVETMDTFVDSSWYYMRYTDPKNETAFASTEAQNAWMPVDLYFGGSEHTTMHLLYSRFVQKALFDMGHTSISEPYSVRINRGLVLGPDGNKMSKSKGNVIDPDEQVARLGADTVKMYLAFMGPYAQPSNYPWDMGGIVGLRRFLERVNSLDEKICDTINNETTRLLHQTIKKVTDDIAQFKFNTAISALMIFLNSAEKTGLGKNEYETFLLLLAPFAPHLAEELWEILGKTDSIHTENWPLANAQLLENSTYSLSVQINGKMRGAIVVPSEITEQEAVEVASKDESIARHLDSIVIVRVVWVKGRVVNFIGNLE